jgi:5-formyltetrahydrofolate cyclo-ligase
MNHPQVLMAYWPLPDEVDIRPLIKHLVAEGCTVLLPKVLDDERMELRRYASEADLAEGAFHIMEPVGEPYNEDDQIQVALVPGMAFDAAGHRLGRGRGYYDRFLSSHLLTVPTVPEPVEGVEGFTPHLIGVCFDFQKVESVPHDANDIPVDMVI